MDDRLPADLAAPMHAFRAARPDLRVDLRWFATLPSTMDAAAEALAAGDAIGVVVVAGAQTAGRGRRGRGWTSPPGAGLYLSMVVRPPVRQDAASLVTLAAGVGVLEGLRAVGISAELKWPNDVIVGPRKLAGILAEGHGVGTPGAAIVVGVGINLRPAEYPPDVAARATSIEGELGRAVNGGTVLAGVVAGVFDRVRDLDSGPGGILQAWRAASPLAVGARVEWEVGGKTTGGLTAGIDPSGALLVQTTSGIDRIVGGEVRWTSVD